MSALAATEPTAADAPLSPAPSAAAAIAAAMDRAGRRIAPVWPLKHFVAVNPYLGLGGLPFADAARVVERTAGARMLMDRAFYADAMASGRIADADLAAALAAARAGSAAAPGLPADVEALKAAASLPSPGGAPTVPTVADVAARIDGADWARFAAERISRWAAAHFDEGQSSWRSPWRDMPPYAAWKAEAGIDRTPEVAGLAGFRAAVAAMPDDAHAAAAAAIAALGVPDGLLDDYLHRLLMTVGGWAAWARYRVWEAELRGGADGALDGLLAIRLAWEAALLETLDAKGLGRAWAEARDAAAAWTPDPVGEAARATDMVLQDAYERAWRRELLAKMRPAGPAPVEKTRPAVQAAFCIDVRSEILRRALETVSPDVETVGFAGFFGFPIEYVPLGHVRGGAQCPVLLTPKFVVCEEVKGAAGDEETEILGLRLVRRRAAKAWKSFKLAAVSSFAFVETMGLAFAAKLATDSLGATRPVAHPSADGLDRDSRTRLGPRMAAREVGGRPTGFDADARLAMAEAVLKAMSMTDGFGRLVLLAGHGSTTVNNPHATGLDCGACGGHTGEANARIAAMILNDPDVRTGLAAKGILVPGDTVFLGALHDTTTDEVAVFDAETVPTTHARDLADLEAALAQAAKLARAERAQLLRLEAGEPVDAAVVARSRDWSQVRPEWGLAGCAAFVAAPRRRTRSLDLGGRSFLHSYDWKADAGFPVLELIMTAPMVVASWISLQYYGSTVDNRTFGSGNKVLHNVVGTLGVLEGNGGDLRVGLPMQSVHDGDRFVHEPMRLNVLIEAPVEAMTDVIARHAAVRELLDNGWLHLFAIGEDGSVSHRYAGGLEWEPVAAG
jgi:uncharacterized protein YbcC (UPF0753/DUF2309 family)